MDSPFLRLDDRDYAEVLTDAAVLVLSDHGIDRFSVRALARWMRVSPSAVLNDYSRARVLEMINICFVKRWLAWSATEPLFGPRPASVPLRLPEDPDEVIGIRALAALELLAEGERVRGNRVPGFQLDHLRDQELALLRHRLEQALKCCDADASDQQVAAVMALVRGLRHTLADPGPRLTPAEAGEILRRYVDGVHAAGCPNRQEAS